MGVALWPADSDEFSRGQMHLSHTNIEERAAIFRQDAFANRGSASTWTRSFFYDETNAILYYSDGTEWKKLTDFGTAAVKVVPGNTASGGSSDQAARIDHRHEVDPWGTTGQLSQVGTTANSGSTSAYARVDHVHVLGSNSVTAGKIANGAINSSSTFTAGVVDNAALGAGVVTKAKISPDQQLPAGVIMAYGGATAPTGWLLCDGTSYSKATYPDLWSVLSLQNYGSNTNNFNVPDLRDRLARGAATTGTSLGATAGSDTVTIGAANLPNHTHSVGTYAIPNHSDHTHALNGSGAAASSANAAHTHPFGPLSGSGSLTNSAISRFGGATFLIFGGGNDPYQLMPPYWGGRPSDAGVFESGASVENTAVSVTIGATNTGAASGNANHSHSLTGNSAGSNNVLTHASPTGNSGNPVGTVGQPLTVLPKTQTVNYIIKT